MNAFEKIIARLEEEKSDWNADYNVPTKKAIEIVNQVAEEYGNGADEHDLMVVGALPSLYPLQDFEEEAIQRVVVSKSGGGWIPVSERLPEAETEVLIHARRKYTGGHFKDIITTAMYEDGTVREVDSCWYWEEVDGEWDKEEGCMIIPKGWWENKHYNGDDEFNHAVDDKVIEWKPLPELPLPESYKAERK